MHGLLEVTTTALLLNSCRKCVKVALQGLLDLLDVNLASWCPRISVDIYITSWNQHAGTIGCVPGLRKRRFFKVKIESAQTGAYGVSLLMDCFPSLGHCIWTRRPRSQRDNSSEACELQPRTLYTPLNLKPCKKTTKILRAAILACTWALQGLAYHHWNLRTLYMP